MNKGDRFKAKRTCTTEYQGYHPHTLYLEDTQWGGEHFDEGSSDKILVLHEIPETEFIFLGWSFIVTGYVYGCVGDTGNYQDHGFTENERIKVAKCVPAGGSAYRKPVNVLPDDVPT
jgi:hypothetical protein